jgi:protein involved in polysaccharide export with SLBB domain
MKRHNLWGMISLIMLGALWISFCSGLAEEKLASTKSAIKIRSESPTNTVTPAESDSPSKLEFQPKTGPDHKIQPLEVIFIDVFGETNLTKDYRVTASGEITFHLLGKIMVASKTTTEVENELKERLGKEFLVDPQVIVTVKEYRNRFVNVMGEVVKAGAYPLQGEQKWTILDAIGQAGGFTRGASHNKIEFTHKGVTRKFSERDLKKIDLDPNKVIYCEPGDTVNVKSSWY